MKALECHNAGCENVISPRDARRVVVDGDGGWEPWCDSCTRKLYDAHSGPWYLGKRTYDEDYPTLDAADELPVPGDRELEEWAGNEGQSNKAFVADCEHMLARMIDEGEVRVEQTVVPYGSTVLVLDDVEIPERVIVATAYQWWEDDRLNWSTRVGPVLEDGSRHVWLEATGMRNE